MQNTTPKSQQIYQWLLDRGLTDTVIASSGITWNGREIVIPVRDVDGNFLFNKYRKDPFNTDDRIPKYRYELGSVATLYNGDTVKDVKNNIVFIVEGELDCLRMNSLGFYAVSSTGGSGTFRPEWLLHFCGNDIYIVYDKDDAGIRGALRINSMIKSAKIVFLPDDTKGKDITDYFTTHSIKQFEELVAHAQSWTIPDGIVNPPRTKAETDKVIKLFLTASDDLLERQRDAISKGESIRHIEILNEIIFEKTEYWKKHKANLGKTFAIGNDDIARAKSVPITNFITFRTDGFAKCLWHNEKTPSMKYREERNKVYCHGCGAHKDTIDVVMAQQEVDFNTAIKIILGKS